MSAKDVIYFNEGKAIEDTQATLSYPEATIQKNDHLNITVSSLNPEATSLFNISTSTVNTEETVNGYWVDSNGDIQFPLLGEIKAAGLTKEALRKEILSKLKERALLTDPIVNIRYLNFRVTIVGEVNHPMVVHVPSEKISIMEVLGMAGDLTIYGNRKKVLLIREENGVKQIIRLNLNAADLLSSPYYYLKTNDVVYVEPVKQRIKVADATTTQNRISLTIGLLTIAAIIVSRISF
ncbi:MAG: polysaccharide biosynthesis/export family protein [Bacteroidetes bacterium]|nr:polysaccharide biosynthesis/export family protein [Bacteroidota bacterium]